MTMSPKDRALGMDRKISRRDFLDGVAIGAGLVAAVPRASEFEVHGRTLLITPRH